MKKGEQKPLTEKRVREIAREEIHRDNIRKLKAQIVLSEQDSQVLEEINKRLEKSKEHHIKPKTP